MNMDVMRRRVRHRYERAMPEGRPWHHRPDGRFRNPKGSPVRDADVARLLRFMARMMRRGSRRVDVPPGHVLPEGDAIEALRAHLGVDSLTWLGHAAFLLRIGATTVITDPYLTDFAGPPRLGPKRFVPSGIGIDKLPPIDVLLISHNHYDHLDEQTINLLPGKETITVVAPLRLGDFFRVRGYRHVVELDWHDHLSVGDIRVDALPVVHWSRRKGFDTNRTLWTGFGISGKGRNLFFGGDSAYGPIFRETGERYGPFDLAMLGIGAYEPREIMHASHATPEEAVRMGLDLGARRLVGMHWGTVILTEEPPFEPPARFVKEGMRRGFTRDDLWVMRIGETRSLPEPMTSWPDNRPA